MTQTVENIEKYVIIYQTMIGADGRKAMKRRVMLNEDWMHFLFITHENGRRANRESALEYIRRYKDSNLTDFIMNVNGTVSSSASKVFETWSDKYAKVTENGVPVNYKNTVAETHYELFETEKTDIFGLWTDELHKMGINPWLSFRMNDVHGDTEGFTSFRKAEIIEKHPEWWISRFKEDGTREYFDLALDYSVPEVRELYYSYIKEQLERYDVYGIELDFTREPYCFPIGSEVSGIPVMIGFVKSVRELADAVGKRRNKKIFLSLLCPADPVNAYKMGFDISAMSKQGLVDFVAASPRWETINNDIPVAIWKHLLTDKTKFGCVQQLLVSGYPTRGKFVAANADMAFGQAHSFLSKGADFIYLYNYFYECEKGITGAIHPTSFRSGKSNPLVVKNIAEPELFDRRYPLTYDDFLPLGRTPQGQLPKTVENNNPVRFRIPVGKESIGAEKYLIISTSSPIDPKKSNVSVNGKPAEYCGDNKADLNITPINSYTFGFVSALGEEASVRISSSEKFTVEYAEILVKA